MQDLAQARLRSGFSRSAPLERAGGDAPLRTTLDAAVNAAARHLLVAQRPDGHWVFELEADATIPAEFVMLRRFFGLRDPAREERIGR